MIDWHRIVLNLRGKGLSTRRIAKEAGCSYANVSRITNHSTHGPRLPTALRLLDLHYDLCPELHRPDVVGEP